MTPSVKPGQKVQAGQQIGRLYDDKDNTHLHFEVYKRGKGGHLNPSQIYPDLFKPGSQGGGGVIQGAVTSPGATNPPPAPGADSAANPSDSRNTGKTFFLPKASSGMSYEQRYGNYRSIQDNFELATTKEEERRAQLQGMLPNMNNSFGPGGPVAPNQGGMTAKELQKITKDRNNARQQVQTKTQEMIQQVMSQVAQQNGMNQQMAQQASAMIAQMMSQGKAGAGAAGGQSQYIPSGGQGRGTENSGAGLLKTTASVLNSNLNPLKGLFQ